MSLPCGGVESYIPARAKNIHTSVPPKMVLQNTCLRPGRRRNRIALVIQEIEIEGFRSVRSVRMRLGAVSVVVGENGTGKTNLYRAL